jgi:DNA-binding protein
MTKAIKKTEENSNVVSEDAPEETKAAPTAPTFAPTPQRRSEPNVIYIGKKGVMAYVLSAVLQLSQSSFISIKSRGRAISMAVDVSQVLINRFGEGKFYIKETNLGTEAIHTPEGIIRNVSTCDIIVAKKA